MTFKDDVKALWSITLCALSVLPSQASVISQYDCLSSRCENMVCKLLWWYFHLRQYCWGNMMGAAGGAADVEPFRCCNIRKFGTISASPPPWVMLKSPVFSSSSSPLAENIQIQLVSSSSIVSYFLYSLLIKKNYFSFFLPITLLFHNTK